MSIGFQLPKLRLGWPHYTQQESFLKIVKVSDVLWKVYGKDGTITEFAPIMTPPGSSVPFKLGQSKVTDTHGNKVVYSWDVNAGGVFGNTYPKAVQYEGSAGNGYKVEFFRESRPDSITLDGETVIAR